MLLFLSDKPLRACHQGPTGGQEKKYKVYCPPWPQDTPTQPAVPTRLPMGKSEVCTSRGQGSPGRADDLPRTQARTGQDWAVGVTRTRRGAFIYAPLPRTQADILKHILFLFYSGGQIRGRKRLPLPRIRPPWSCKVRPRQGCTETFHTTVQTQGPD